MKNYSNFIQELNDSYNPGEVYDKHLSTLELLKNSLPIDYVINNLSEFIDEFEINNYVKIVGQYFFVDYLAKLTKEDNNANTIEIQIKYSDKYPLRYIENLIIKILGMGWYIGKIRVFDGEDEKETIIKKTYDFFKIIKSIKYTSLVFLCERRYPIEGMIYTNDILYHLTTMDKLPNIKDSGLLPKNSGIKKSYHPKRIYFCKNIKCINSFIQELDPINKPPKKVQYANGTQKSGTTYALLSIDPSKLYYDTINGEKEQIYFFNDFNKKDSLYTNFSIDFKYVTIIKTDIKP